MVTQPRGAVPDVFWAYHSYPKSGWSRRLVTPLFLTSTYRRDRWLLAVTVMFTAINPLLFTPSTETDN